MAASFNIEMVDVEQGQVHKGVINQGYVHENDHLQVPQPQYGLTSRNNNHKDSVDIIPDLDESGFQPFRQHLVCPYCKRSIITDIHMRNGRRVWITFCMLILTGFCLIVPFFFCYIAFLMEWLKDVIHFCPKCKNRLGKYVRD